MNQHVETTSEEDSTFILRRRPRWPLVVSLTEVTDSESGLVLKSRAGDKFELSRKRKIHSLISGFVCRKLCPQVTAANTTAETWSSLRGGSWHTENINHFQKGNMVELRWRGNTLLGSGETSPTCCCCSHTHSWVWGTTTPPVNHWCCSRWRAEVVMELSWAERSELMKSLCWEYYIGEYLNSDDGAVVELCLDSNNTPTLHLYTPTVHLSCRAWGSGFNSWWNGPGSAPRSREWAVETSLFCHHIWTLSWRPAVMWYLSLSTSVFFRLWPLEVWSRSVLQLWFRPACRRSWSSLIRFWRVSLKMKTRCSTGSQTVELQLQIFKIRPFKEALFLKGFHTHAVLAVRSHTRTWTCTCTSTACLETWLWKGRRSDGGSLTKVPLYP